ncbi:MAG: Mrp/NBP35 family ATP-binding protein [Candidatus Omnitrophica bacterium]|nr:Mrp/NBP35 family ATP-binding protein [Candidatus Omnitrophota bacterium]
MNKEEIINLLKEVQDPELERDIVTLGMLRDVRIQGAQVVVQLEIASPSEAFRSQIKSRIEKKLSQNPEIKKVEVEISAPVKQGPAFSAKQQISGIDHIVAVASGKGGVGKTTVAVNLACALVKEGYQVGLMDGDIYGPNVPLMLGISHETRPHVNPEGKIIPLEKYGLKVISMGILVPPDQPMVWRGPMLHSAVTQFLQKVDWGKLDYLLVDLPPGTGDVQLSLVQTVPLSGAVIVTTPQEVALMDVRKGIAMFRKTNVPILGIIENMTGEIFGSGGGEKAAAEFEAPYLGSIPLDGRVREGGDQGKPVVMDASERPSARAIIRAAEMLNQTISNTKV